MKEILLSKSKVAIVDDEDYPVLSRIKWHLTYGEKYVGHRIMCSGKQHVILMHQLIMGLHFKEIDHINGNGLDNQKLNLRHCTRAQNIMNQHKRKGTRSRFKGVYSHTTSPKWRAILTLNGKQIYLGYHDTEEEAARAYDIAAREHFGEFARTNFP